MLQRFLPLQHGWLRRCCQRSFSTSNEWMDIQIDRSGLMKQHNDTDIGSTKLTKLPQYLRTMIEVRGPLTVHEFMRQCLGHPEWGYYMKDDVFGSKGDFTTAPEISQMFGELIGIWCLATWHQLGSPETIHIVEFGPGRGTLQYDLLSAAKMFPDFYNAIEIHLIEFSPSMRQLQQQTLKCTSSSSEAQLSIPNGPPIHWHYDLSDVPKGPTLFLAQEFFDALPVHQFQYTERFGWCERLVDMGDPFRFVLSNGATPAVRAYLGNERLLNPQQGIQFTERPTDDDGPSVMTTDAQEGDRFEFCPTAVAVISDIAKRIATHSGAALIVDYGYDHMSSDSLRGIRQHAFVDPLSQAGETDLSIDVDFATLRRFATEAHPETITTYGPISQELFLKEMGIEHRLAALLDVASDEATKEQLITAYNRLVQQDQMGHIFKVLSIASPTMSPPVGFPSTT